MFKENEEIWELASTFASLNFARSRGEEVGSELDEAKEKLIPLIREQNPTIDSPYAVYLDGDTYCDIWFDDAGDLHAGELYEDDGMPDDQRTSDEEGE